MKDFEPALRAMIESAERDFEQKLEEARVTVNGPFHSSRLAAALITLNRADQIVSTLRSVRNALAGTE